MTKVLLLLQTLLIFATIEIASILYNRMFFLFQNVIHELKEGTDKNINVLLLM